MSLNLKVMMTNMGRFSPSLSKLKLSFYILLILLGICFFFTIGVCFYILLIILGIYLFFPVGYVVLDQKKTITDTSTPQKDLGVYLINLDRSVDRYDYMKPQLDQLGYPITRVSAIDGQHLSDEYIKEVLDHRVYEKKFGHYTKKGAIGCSLSHIKAWEAFLNSDFKYGIIFEDDGAFDPEELRSVIEKLKEKSEKWDIVSFEIGHRGMPLTLEKINEKHRLVQYLTHVSHGGCYMINRKTAVKLLEKALPIKMPVDHYFTRGWELDFVFMGIEPRIVHQKFGNSEIGNTKNFQPSQKNTLSKWEKIASKFFRSIYIFQTHLVKFLYNLISYINHQLKIL